ncbi:hypothetical protein [Bradyrhizobium sp.]|uniref:hypothetical protein n=1 Tax=Bradyrhizobium sp. TaxID=376 RepID=UPI003C530267
MITLDPVQVLALRKSAVEPVKIAGASGTGKSTLANAIAAQSSRHGKSCLLIGASAVLDRAAGYRVLGENHHAVADRAQWDHSSGARSDDTEHSGALQWDPIEARARANPARARLAVRTLQQARELAARHDLRPSEIEHSVATDRPLAPEAANCLSLAIQDALRIADVLWSGNRRAGRSLKDVDDVIAGRPVEVPPEDDALSLILAHDREYETSLAKIVAGHKELEGEYAISTSVASLLRPRSLDKTLSEYHKHASLMARTFGSAIALIRKHRTLQAALDAGSGTDAAKVIEYVIRMRPEQGAGAAVRTFEAAMQDYRHDSAVLDPLLGEYGHRALGSFAAVPTGREGQLKQEIGTLVQRLREARYAARHLPAYLQPLRAALSKTQFERICRAPLEEAFAQLESAAPDARAMAATEMRQLRELFASTGFGDLLDADDDFVDKVEHASAAPPQAAALLPQPYSPQVLDLLLDLTTFTEQHEAAEWPASVMRARTAQEALDAIGGAARFDVAVIDDVSDYPLHLAHALETSGATVHRIGVTDHDAAIVLAMPHRQSDADIAAATSGQPNRWIGASGSFGIVVRTDPRLESAQLSSAADRLVLELRKSGCNAAQASTGRLADVIVASVDELRDADVAAFAKKARQGIVVVCRSNRRSPPAAQDRRREPDIKSAEALGWLVSRTAIDGTVLERDGRSVALIREPVALSPGDETVADVAARLTGLGWRPVVLWRGAERAPQDLESLLAGHSVPTGTNPFRKIAETFSLAEPQQPVANAPVPGIGNDVEPAAEEKEQSVIAAAAVQPLQRQADSVPSYSAPDTPAALDIRTEGASHPAQEQAQHQSDRDDGETDAAEPQASDPMKLGAAVEPDSSQHSADQEEAIDQEKAIDTGKDQAADQQVSSPPARAQAQREPVNDGEPDAAEPHASRPLKLGVVVEPDSPQQTASQEESSDAGEDQEVDEQVGPDDSGRRHASAPDFDPDRRPTAIPPISGFP